MPAGEIEKLEYAAYEAAIWWCLGCPKAAFSTIEAAIIDNYESQFGSKGESREEASLDPLPHEVK